MKKLDYNHLTTGALTVDASHLIGVVNDLIDLVNSQQEAIEKLEEHVDHEARHVSEPADNVEAIGELQTEIGVLRNMVLQSQEAIEKLEKQVHGTKRIDHLVTSVTTAEGGIVTIRFNEEALKEYAKSFVEPADDRPKAITVDSNGIPTIPQPVDYSMPTDTHRTVTLRIPKGMRVGDAFNLAYLFSDSSWEEFITRSDTDLQKALDEVKE